MDWAIIIGVAVAVAFIQWEGKRLHLATFLKEVLIIWGVLFFANILKEYSFLNIIPEKIVLWIGGLIFFGLTLFLSVKSWYHSKKGNKN